MNYRASSFRLILTQSIDRRINNSASSKRFILLFIAHKTHKTHKLKVSFEIIAADLDSNCSPSHDLDFVIAITVSDNRGLLTMLNEIYLGVALFSMIIFAAYSIFSGRIERCRNYVGFSFKIKPVLMSCTRAYIFSSG